MASACCLGMDVMIMGVKYDNNKVCILGWRELKRRIAGLK